MQTIVISSLSDLDVFASTLAKQLEPGSVVALKGELGAGKTTFTQLLAKHVGIKKPLTSPTFSLMNHYEFGNGQLFIHLDLYRLHKKEEVLALGLQEFIDEQDHIIVIEWPKIAQSLLPEKTIWIQFSIIDETTRKIEIK